VEQVAVFSLDDAQPFVEEMQGKAQVPRSIHIASSAAEVAENADIICTATNATTPVLQKKEVRPGTHINAVGSYTPAMRELDPRLLPDVTLVVDQISATMDEAGEVIAAVSEGLIREDELVELGRVIDGAHPGRQSESEVTVFKSVGVATQDLCAAGRALARAEAAGIGSEIDL